MNKILEKNLEVLHKYNEYIEFEDVESYKEENPLIMTLGDKSYQMSSIFDMDHVIEVWLSQFEDVTYQTIFVIYGFGHPGYVRALTAKYPDNIIIVFEPMNTNFLDWLCNEDLSDLWQNDKILFAAGLKNLVLFADIMNLVINTISMAYLMFACIPNYKDLFKDEENKVFEIITNRKLMCLYTNNTVIADEKSRAYALLHNLNDVKSQYGLNDLIKEFVKVGMGNRSAVIVAAGPSLDKNVQELKRAKNKAFILCTDSAIRTMLRYDIIPDIMISIDPEKSKSLFESEAAQKIPMMVNARTNPEVVELISAKRFYMANMDKYFDGIIEKFGQCNIPISTGGSVANNAFTVAHLMGFKDIILIGQDLGYPNKQIHTSDSYDGGGIIEEDENKYYYVEDIYGGQILTEGNMDFYRRWFEQQTAMLDVHLIDATEGGAKINGTEILTLDEALSKYSDNLEELDYQEIINRCPPFFSEEVQKEFGKFVYKTYQDIDEMLRKLEDGRRTYQKLEKLIQKGDMSSSTFRSTIKKIGELNEWMKNDIELCIFELYNNTIEVSTQEQLRAKAGDTKEEFKLIIKCGYELIDGYIEAGKKLKEQWGPIISYEE